VAEIVFTDAAVDDLRRLGADTASDAAPRKVLRLP
jgi:hypothetical protein